MPYHIINQIAGSPTLVIEDYNQLLHYVEGENYRSKRNGDLGALLTIRQFDDKGQLVQEKIVTLGYTDYTEAILENFEPRSRTKTSVLFKFIKRLFNVSRKKKKGDNQMTAHKPKQGWVYDGEPLEPTEKTSMVEQTENTPSSEPNPDESRAEIAASLKYQEQEKSSDIAKFDKVDYAKQYQEQGTQSSSNKVRDQLKQVDEMTENQSSSPVSTESQAITEQSQHLTTVQKSNDLFDAAILTQENLVRNIAKITDDRSLIRQKILENRAIIAQARQAEAENEVLEMEYKKQDKLIQKLQEFHHLFDECREYLN